MPSDLCTTTGHYAPINQLHLYYERTGSGQPLIVLHGGFGATGMFAALLPLLAHGREVIAVDLQAHGRTADTERPFSYDAFADDIGALLRQLDLPAADIMGYSLGGSVALRTALRYPAVVRKVVLVSTPFKHDGWYPEVCAAMQHMGADLAEAMMHTPMYDLYARIAPHPEDWPMLLTKTGQLLRQPYDWSEEIRLLTAPTLLVLGDADSVPPAHAVAFFDLLGGGRRDGGWDGSGMVSSQLAILPGTTHSTIFQTPRLAATVTRFLDAGTCEQEAHAAGHQRQ